MNYSYPTRLPVITAIQDRSVVTLQRLKEFLGVPAAFVADDFLFGLALKGAKEAGDLYCNNPFTDESNDPADIPASVEIGILHLAAFVSDKERPGITSKRTDLLAETYGTTEETLAAIQVKYWALYRLNPGL